MILTRPYIKLFRRLGLLVIKPFNESYLQTNSYDVTLWNHFWDVNWREHRPYYRYIFAEEGTSIQVPCNGTLLAATKEIIGSRWCIIPLMKGKSSIGRMGIDVCGDAGLGDIQYIDHWTAELTARIQGNAWLQIGQPFAQIVFYLAAPTWIKYAGQYSMGTWPLVMVPQKYRIGYEKEKDRDRAFSSYH